MDTQATALQPTPRLVASMRKDAGLTQEQAARRARKALRTWVALERGEHVNTETVECAATVLGQRPGAVLEASINARVDRRVRNFRLHAKLKGGLR